MCRGAHAATRITPRRRRSPRPTRRRGRLAALALFAFALFALALFALVHATRDGDLHDELVVLVLEGDAGGDGEVADVELVAERERRRRRP